MNQAPLRQSGMNLSELIDVPRKQSNLLELPQIDQTGTQPVIKVVIVIGDFIGKVTDLRFQRGLLAFEKPFAQCAQLPGVFCRTVFDDSFAGFEAEIQSFERRVTLFEQIDDAQTLQVMFKAATIAHATMQRLLSGVAEGRVSEIMRQRDGFDQIFVQPQRPGDTATDLRYLQGVRQAGSEQVALVVDEDLRFVFETSKGG